jgi:hypothetical protein
MAELTTVRFLPAEPGTYEHLQPASPAAKASIDALPQDDSFACADAAELAGVVEDLADVVGELIKVAHYQSTLIDLLMDMCEVTR